LTLLDENCIDSQLHTFTYNTYKKSLAKFRESQWNTQAALLFCFGMIKYMICEKECLYILNSKVEFTNESSTFYQFESSKNSNLLSLHDENHQTEDEYEYFDPDVPIPKPNFARIPKDWVEKIIIKFSEFHGLTENYSWKKYFNKGNQTRELFHFLLFFILHYSLKNDKKKNLYAVMYYILKRLPFLPALICDLFFALKSFVFTKLQQNHLDIKSFDDLKFCSERLLLLQADLHTILRIIMYCSDNPYIMNDILNGINSLSTQDYNI